MSIIGLTIAITGAAFFLVGGEFIGVALCVGFGVLVARGLIKDNRHSRENRGRTLTCDMRDAPAELGIVQSGADSDGPQALCAYHLARFAVDFLAKRSD